MVSVANHFPPIHLYIILALVGTLIGLTLRSGSTDPTSWWGKNAGSMVKVFRIVVPFLWTHLMLYAFWGLLLSSGWATIHLTIHMVSILLLGWTLKTAFRILNEKGASVVEMMP